MPKERFLLYMLAGVFTFQAGTFAYGLHHCTMNGGLKACPELGKRYDQTFNVMIATLLGLLTGSTLGKNS